MNLRFPTSLRLSRKTRLSINLIVIIVIHVVNYLS